MFVLYGLVNGWIAEPVLTKLIFSDVWKVAMVTLVPLMAHKPEAAAKAHAGKGAKA